jgi:multidrug efflux pump subunit AcrB
MLQGAPDLVGSPARDCGSRGRHGAAAELINWTCASERRAKNAVNHQGQFPSVTLSFNVTPGHSLGQAVERIQTIERDLHTPITLQGMFQGTAGCRLRSATGRARSCVARSASRSSAGSWCRRR